MRRILVALALLAACTVREDPPIDSSRVVAATLKAGSDTAAPVATPYNPDDSGPADTPQVLAMWEDRKRRGVDFFGVGQEPGWMIEIDEGKRLYLLANYAEDTVDVVAPAPVADPAIAGMRVYRTTANGHTLVVTIELRPCADAMSGKRYPETVMIALDGKVHDGCGREVK